MTNLQKKFTVEGGIEVLSADITFDKNTVTGEINNAHLNSTIQTKCNIEGVVIEFKSHISHMLTDIELSELISKLNIDNHAHNK